MFGVPESKKYNISVKKQSLHSPVGKTSVDQSASWIESSFGESERFKGSFKASRYWVRLTSWICRIHIPIRVCDVTDQSQPLYKSSKSRREASGSKYSRQKPRWRTYTTSQREVGDWTRHSVNLITAAQLNHCMILMQQFLIGRSSLDRHYDRVMFRQKCAHGALLVYMDRREAFVPCSVFKKNPPELLSRKRGFQLMPTIGEREVLNSYVLPSWLALNLGAPWIFLYFDMFVWGFDGFIVVSTIISRCHNTEPT